MLYEALIMTKLGMPPCRSNL